MDPERISERGPFFHKEHAQSLKDYRLEFNKEASRNSREEYPNIVTFQNGIVEGVPYEINDSDLLEMDKFEGYPNHYSRTKVKGGASLSGRAKS